MKKLSDFEKSLLAVMCVFLLGCAGVIIVYPTLGEFHDHGHTQPVTIRDLIFGVGVFGSGAVGSLILFILERAGRKTLD